MSIFVALAVFPKIPSSFKLSDCHVRKKLIYQTLNSLLNPLKYKLKFIFNFNVSAEKMLRIFQILSASPPDYL